MLRPGRAPDIHAVVENLNAAPCTPWSLHVVFLQLSLDALLTSHLKLLLYFPHMRLHRWNRERLGKVGRHKQRKGLFTDPKTEKTAF